ncbi:hypothetical protein AALP_AA1G201400, partial [Arabis alpina]
MEGEAGLETQDWDECLPPRLFATDRYPDARLNIYSKPKILLQIQDILKGTDELQRIKDSSFGQLWDIPFSRCPISCKLVYALLCRQVLTKKKYELWTVFGGHPLRFSLAEFGYITGLECGDFPEEYKPNPADEITAADVPYWRKLIGDNFDATLEDIHEMLSSDDMPGWRRLGLALILLVDGVLIARHQKQRTVPTPKYVAMLEDVEAFMRFPWGRESFLRTAKCMIPTQPQSPHVSKRKKVVREEDPVAELQRRLQQKTVHLEDPRDLRTLSDTEATGIPKQTILNIEQVREAENNSKLTVDFLVPLDTHDQWEDEIRARKTMYMEQLIREGSPPSTTESVPINDDIHVDNVKHDAVCSEYGGVDNVIRELDEELSAQEEAEEGRGFPSEMVGESPDVMIADSTECTGPKNVRNCEADKSVIVETSGEVPLDDGVGVQTFVDTTRQGMDIVSATVKSSTTVPVDVGVDGQSCVGAFVQGMYIDSPTVKAPLTTPLDVSVAGQTCGDTTVQ